MKPESILVNTSRAPLIEKGASRPSWRSTAPRQASRILQIKEKFKTLRLYFDGHKLAKRRWPRLTLDSDVILLRHGGPASDFVCD